MISCPPSRPCDIGKLSFNDHIGKIEDRGRDRQADRLGGLQVDGELESRRLLDRQIGGRGPLQDLGDIAGREARVFHTIWAVAGEAAIGDTLRILEGCRQPVRESKIQDT